jgi:AmmeMemoRadiSam system protein B
MIREPAVAGQFYSGNAASLRRTIASFLEKGESLLEAKAVVSPHAGYVYSGAVAGAVYSAVKLPKRIIVLGPNHTGRGVALSLHPPGEWLTPLGTVAIDTEMNRRLLEECPGLREDRVAHVREHSLEVQIPFLQSLVPEFRFSAICVGTADYASLDSLGHAMACVVQSLGEPVLVVASSDMTHYEPADVAREKDQLAIDRVIAVDPRGIFQFGWDVKEKLPHQEDTEELDHLQNRNPRIRVQQAQGPHDDERGDQGHLHRHHHRAEVEQEQHVAPPEAQSGKGVAGEHRGEHGTHGFDRGNQEGIEQPAPQWILVPGLSIVLPPNLAGRVVNSRLTAATPIQRRTSPAPESA